MSNNNQSEEEFLKSYDDSKYKKPSVASDMVVFTVASQEEDNYRKLPKKSLKVLLIQRGGHPFKNYWALPGGFVNPDENFLEAAKRELQEETGVKDVYLEQLYTFSDAGRDPRGWMVSCSHLALVDSSKLKVKAGSDAKEAKWFNVSYQLIKEDKEDRKDGLKKTFIYKLNLSCEDILLAAIIEKEAMISENGCAYTYKIRESKNIAFDHGKIIGYAIERLRNKLSYTSMAFYLLPKRFTLTECQKVYESILEEKLLAANFRRKIGHLVIETDLSTKDAGHRPSKLYKKNFDLFT